MRTLWLLHELDLDFSLRIRPFDRSLRDPEYLSLNPAGRVPALEIDGDTYFESGAIAEILCERFPANELGRPPGDIDRPEYLIWLHFAETITQHAAVLTQHHLFLREEHMRSVTVMRLEAQCLERCFAAIEARLSTPLENRDYLLTSGFSAADVNVGQAVYMARHFATLDRFPEVARWYDTITDRDAFRQSLPPKGAELLYDRAFYAPESC